MNSKKKKKCVQIAQLAEYSSTPVWLEQVQTLVTFIVLSIEQQIPSDICTHHIVWDEYLGNSSLYESHNFFSGLPHDRMSQWWFLFV